MTPVIGIFAFDIDIYGVLRVPLDPHRCRANNRQRTAQTRLGHIAFFHHSNTIREGIVPLVWFGIQYMKRWAPLAAFVALRLLSARLLRTSNPWPFCFVPSDLDTSSRAFYLPPRIWIAPLILLAKKPIHDLHIESLGDGGLYP